MREAAPDRRAVHGQLRAICDVTVDAVGRVPESVEGVAGVLRHRPRADGDDCAVRRARMLRPERAQEEHLHRFRHCAGRRWIDVPAWAAAVPSWLGHSQSAHGVRASLGALHAGRLLFRLGLLPGHRIHAGHIRLFSVVCPSRGFHV